MHVYNANPIIHDCDEHILVEYILFHSENVMHTIYDLTNTINMFLIQLRVINASKCLVIKLCVFKTLSINRTKRT